MQPRDYVLITDTGCDLPASIVTSCQLAVISMAYELDGTLYDGFTAPYQNTHTFYSLMRNGSIPVTRQIIPDQAKAFFASYLRQNLDILFVGFSGGLSASCSSCRAAADELNADCGERRIIVIDSLSASLGQGLLVYLASQKKKDGMDIDELAQWVSDTRLHICHNFTVEDLNSLSRGGRISKTSAVLGSVLNIKPVLHIDDSGQLVTVNKIRSRKASLDALVNQMGSALTGFTNSICFISHGDCPEDAQYVADAVRRRFGISEFLISEIGPVIGSHAGPGTVALFFLGDRR